MNKLLIHTHGQLEYDGSSWIVRLDDPPDIFEEGSKVHMVVWTNTDLNLESDIERIARIQQLPVEVVALALASEGALLKP